MKSKIKKCLSIIMAAFLLFTNISLLSFASESQSNPNISTMRQYLLEKGTPEDYLRRIPDYIVKDLYTSLYKSDDIVKISFSTQTHSSYPSLNISSSSPLGMINEDNFSLTIGFFAHYSPSDNYLTQLGVLVLWNWSGGNPMVRNEDAIIINWDNNLFSLDSNYFAHCDYHENRSGERTEFNATKSPSFIGTSGNSFGLYSNVYWGLAENRGGVYSFTLRPKNLSSMYQGSTRNTSVAVTYYHDKRLPPLNIIGPSFGLEGGSSITINTNNLTDSLAKSTLFWYSN